MELLEPEAALKRQTLHCNPTLGARASTSGLVSPTSVQFKGEINDALPRKRHQKRHLEFCTAYLLRRRKFNPKRCSGCAYEFRAILVLLQGCSKKWLNWQTRRAQNPVAARPCGFDPLVGHQTTPPTTHNPPLAGWLLWPGCAS